MSDSSHLSDEQLVALLHGTMSAEARTAAKSHLAACEPCSATLAREAAVDEVLWAARPHAAPQAAGARRRRAPIGWIVGAAITAALVYTGATAPAMAPRSNDMGDVLAWQNLIFYIPLALGVLLVLGSFFTAHDAGHDPGHDLGHDHDHDAGHGIGLGGRALSLLGIGRVPLTVALMMASFLFGGIGILVNTILSSAGLAAGTYGPIALTSAVVYTLLLARPTAALVRRVLPATESYTIARRDFIGCTGALLLPADPTTGLAQVKDPEGNVHNVKCRAVKGPLAKGTTILIVDYDEDTKTYLVDVIPKLG
jgi:hypothetical protein